jgi:AraC-like DNA-binding protein
MTNGEYSGILIYAQITRENYIHTVFFELVDKAKELAEYLNCSDKTIYARLKKMGEGYVLQKGRIHRADELLTDS